MNDRPASLHACPPLPPRSTLAQAFLYNFVSALTAIFGTVLMLALRDTLTAAQISFTLLLGAGSFIFIALTELVPEALVVSTAATAGGVAAVGPRNGQPKSGRSVRTSQARKLASFAAGAAIIGIPLIFDQHCDAGHEGHDH